MVKPIKKTMRIFSAAILILLGLGLLWLQSGAHQLPWVKDMLVAQLQKHQSAYRIAIDEVVVDWRDVTRVGAITLKNIALSDAQGDAFARFPEVDLELSVWRLLSDANALERVVVQRPRIYMAREADGAILLGIDENRATLSLQELFAHMAGEGAANKAVGKIPFDELEIRNAHFQLRQSGSQAPLKSKRFTAKLARDGEAYALQFTLPMKAGDTEGLLEGGARRIHAKDGWALNMRVDSVPLQWMCDVITCKEGWAFAGYVSGKVTGETNADLSLDQLGATLGGVKVQASIPEFFAESLIFDEVQLSTRVGEGLTRFELDKLQLSLPEGSTLQAVADMKLTETDGVVGVMQANMDSLPVGALYKYWPTHLSPESRQWTIDNLSHGTATTSEIVLKLAPGDTQAESLPDEALFATINTDNMHVKFLPGLPAARTEKAVVHFTGETMQVEAEKANALETIMLSNVSLFAPDLNHPSTPMEVSFLVAASAPNAVTVLKSKYFTFDDFLALDENTITGDVSGGIDINFDAYTGTTSEAGEVDLSSVQYDITAELKNVSQEDVLEGVSLHGMDGHVALSNHDFMANGNAKVSGQQMAFHAAQNDADPMRLELRGGVARSQFAGLGLPDVPYVTSGVIGTTVQAFLRKGEVYLERAEFDLTASAWKIPEISWHKPEGKAGTASILKDGDTYRVNVVAEDLYADGELGLEGALGSAVKQASFQRIKSNLNDFSLGYSKAKNGFAVSLKGKRLDASDSYAETDNSLLQNFPPIRLNVDLGELVLAPGASLKEIKGYLNCDQKNCHAASMNGKADNAHFAARIYDDEEGQRTLSIQADDGGDLLSALNITDRVYDGKLSLKGTYDDGMSPPVFKGRLLLTDYLVRNSQIFARLFTIGSLSGLANALSDTGIEFEKLAMNIEAAGGKILVKEGRASGNATGFTTEGIIDTTNAEIHLKGVLVPAFFINSLVNNIPLIGELAGGEGEGVVAFRYTIDGNYGKDPDVTVNPLSGLTPGFLRGFFDIFDKPVPKDLDVEENES